MTEQEREVLIKEVELLKVRKKDVNDFIESIDLADKIHNIKGRP